MREPRRQPIGGLRNGELRSVNNRYLDVSSRLPEEVRTIEPRLRERVRQRLARGKVECGLRIHLSRGSQSELSLDSELAEGLIAAGRELSSMVAAKDPRQAASIPALSPTELLRWPGVLRTSPLDLEAISASVLNLLDIALDDLVSAREREGARIAELIQARLQDIEHIVTSVRKRLPEVLSASRSRLQDRLAELRAELDPERLEQEMVILAHRLDVDEELDRLQTHVGEVRRILSKDEPAGRRLDFMMQELNREANTLGSKSNDTLVTQAAVDLKVLIEQMREQVQNIE